MTPEEKKESDKDYLIALKKHLADSHKIVEYSMQRIDLLTISLSGAGIYACLEILRYIDENNSNDGTTAFKIVGGLFGIAIIFNFISQWAAYYASFYNMESTEKTITDIKQEIDSKKEIAILDKYVDMYGKITILTNLASTILMLAGLICIIIFICITF